MAIISNDKRLFFMIVRYYVIIKDKFKIKYTKYIGSKSASKLN